MRKGLVDLFEGVLLFGEAAARVLRPTGRRHTFNDELGLRLRKGKAPVDTLVVDHAEMPEGN